MAEVLRVVDIALDPRTAGGQARYTYRAPEGAAKGDVHLTPLGARQVLGVVVAVRETSPDELGFDPKSLRYPGERIDELCLPPVLIDVAEQMARRTLSELPSAVGPILAPHSRDRLRRLYRPTGRAPESVPLTPLQQEVLDALRESGELVEAKTKPLPAGVKRALGLLIDKKLVERSTRIDLTGKTRAVTGLLRLTSDGDKIERFLREQAGKRPAQALALIRLQGSEESALSSAEIAAICGVAETTVKAMVASGLLEVVTVEARPTPAPQLNSRQKHAATRIEAAIKGRAADTFLLFGVTGSGKTEVYLHAFEAALKAGRQALFLVPEIALTAQVVAHLRGRFGRSVAVLHSDLPPRERLENWLRIRRGEAPVVLGPRSALFAPLANLGVIAMDEEHEGSYKQESTPRYHARAVALDLARAHRCPLVLGSATPSVESFHAALSGAYTLLEMPDRAVHAARLPDVQIEDLRTGYSLGKPALFTPALHEEMGRTLAAGDQAILFLNRRAYAPFLMCRECGFTFKCPNCSVSLAFHRRDGSLKCHHCRYRTHPSETCPKCCGHKVSPFGLGTERVEETVRLEFPEARVVRLDRDVAEKRGELEKVFAAFRSGEANVLVGTQMVAKGLDFPGVTLVGVLAADLSLNIPDFRATERTFQLLSQVAGRAGRGQRPGRVIIQTFSPESPAIQYARDHDFLGAYETFVAERREMRYPPFCQLANIIASGEDRERVVRTMDEIAAIVTHVLPHAEVLGPADCPLERLHGAYRRHVLVKLPLDDTYEPLGRALSGWERSDVRLVVDVDPYSMA